MSVATFLHDVSDDKYGKGQVVNLYNYVVSEVAEFRLRAERSPGLNNNDDCVKSMLFYLVRQLVYT